MQMIYFISPITYVSQYYTLIYVYLLEYIIMYSFTLIEGYIIVKESTWLNADIIALLWQCM